MSKKRRKKKHYKLKKKPLFALVILIILIVLLGKKAIALYMDSIKNPTTEMYIGTLEYKVQLYNIENFEKSIEVPRGKKVILYEKTVKQTIDDKGTKTKDDDIVKEYRHIMYNNVDYLMEDGYLVKTYEESVPEKVLYVRTSATIYETVDSPNIKDFIKKGSELEILGFDTILDSGKVNMYKIKLNDNDFGYVYGKYLVNTKEEADSVYNENGTYDIHKDRKFSYDLYGGSTKNLDYYPVEKPSFSDNEFLDNAKTYYMNGGSDTLGNVDKYIEVAKTAGANAFVVDIKDGALAYQSEVAKELSPTSYKYAMNSIDNYKKAISKLKQNGFYVIGRIVTFNDTLYATDHPSECIGLTSWVSGFSRLAWEFNVKLALEAIDLFEFNEIQFDYVRFPESSYNYSKEGYNFRNNYNEDKSQAIQNFLIYAVDQIHKKNVYVSADVFGECANTYVTSYGQYWPAISNVVDVISAMPYPDHFGSTDYGLNPPWVYPYELTKTWGSYAAKRQTEIPTPAYVRTWIQAYNAIKYPYNEYGAKEIKAQIQGLWDSGLQGGFITWNGKSNLEKYRIIASGFSGVF